MNTVILMGRFVSDPEVSSYGKDEDQVRASFTLAVQRDGKDAGADFVRCVAFGKRADFIGKYFAKGQRALVSGRWQTGSYENKDKQVIYTNDCYVSNIEFADSKRSSEEAEGFEDSTRGDGAGGLTADDPIL